MADGTANQISGFQGLPTEQLAELAKIHEEVDIKVFRRNHKNIPAVVTTERVAISDLASIEHSFKKRFGGGNFLVEVRDPNNAFIPLLKFTLVVEGGAKAPPPDPDSVPTQGHGPMNRPAYVGYGPAFAQQMSAAAAAQGQQPWYGQFAPPSPDAPPLFSMPSDQMALKQIGDLKAQLARTETEKTRLAEKLEDERRIAKESQDALTKRLDEIERKHEAERHQMQILALKEQINDVHTRKPTTNEWAAVLPAVAPIVIAMIQSSREAQQQQMNMLVSTLARPPADQTPMLTAMMPLLLEQLKQRGPEASAQAMNQVMESQMSSLALISDMMKNMQGEDPPPWMQMVQQAVAGLGAVMQSYREQRLAEPQQPRLVHQGRTFGLPMGPGSMPPPPAQPGPSQHAVDAAGVPVANVYPGVNSSVGGTTFTTPASSVSAETLADMILGAPQFPAEMKTPQWREIIRMIHAMEDVETVTTAFFQHLKSLYDTNATPHVFKNLDQEYTLILPTIISELPVAQMDAEYAKALASALVNRYAGYLQAAASANSSIVDTDGQASSDVESTEEPDADEPKGTNGHVNVLPGSAQRAAKSTQARA